MRLCVCNIYKYILKHTLTLRMVRKSCLLGSHCGNLCTKSIKDPLLEMNSPSVICACSHGLCYN